METKVMRRLVVATKGLKFPGLFDGRGKLAINPRGMKWKTRDPQKLKGLVWHQELGWGSVEAVAKYQTGKDSHLHRGGVESIAYTWAIRRSGQIVLCNDFNKATWSQGYKRRPGDENADFMSVMFEGLFQGPHVTDPSAGLPSYLQLLSGLLLWHACKNVWGWENDDLYGHFLFGKPSCPGHTLQTIIEAVRANIEKPTYELSSVQGRQEALRALGYYTGAVDGLWGPMSKGALIRFQSAHGLTADGVWGPKTQAAIGRALKDR